jgi:hypothetical protein
VCPFQVGEASAVPRGGKGAGPARLVAPGSEPDVANVEGLPIAGSSRRRPVSLRRLQARHSRLCAHENYQLMLTDGCLTDERTQSRLGDDSLDEVLASLWPGDCQSCGQPLGSLPPVLLVDDLGVLIRASLHHNGCRAPGWNDSLLITTSSTGLPTWRTVVLLLPFEAGGEEIRVAGLLVNPAWKRCGWCAMAIRGVPAWTRGLPPRGWHHRLRGYPSASRQPG